VACPTSVGQNRTVGRVPIFPQSAPCDWAQSVSIERGKIAHFMASDAFRVLTGMLMMLRLSARQDIQLVTLRLKATIASRSYGKLPSMNAFVMSSRLRGERDLSAAKSAFVTPAASSSVQ